MLGPGLEMQKVCLRSPAGVKRERGACEESERVNDRKGQRRERQGTASEVGREEPEGKDGIKVRGESKRAQRGKFQAGPKVREEPESVSGWGRSWRGSAPARFPARDRSWAAEARAGRPRQRPERRGGAGGPKWMRKAGPPNHRPRGAGVAGRPGEWPGGRSLTDPGGRHCPPSGGCGRARAVARRAASSGPARAACILPGLRGAGDRPGRRPLGGAGSPRLGTEVPPQRGAPDAGCREPFGAWLDVPAGPGGPFGAGLRPL